MRIASLIDVVVGDPFGNYLTNMPLLSFVVVVVAVVVLFVVMLCCCCLLWCCATGANSMFVSGNIFWAN